MYVYRPTNSCYCCLFPFFYVFKFVISHVCQKPNNLYYFFNVLFYFRKYLFCCIRTTVSDDYISNTVYYRSNSSLEKNCSLHHYSPLLILGSKKGPLTHIANRFQRWGTILLNYNFKMESQPSNKFGHADRLSRLIPKYLEPLEDTVIASLQPKKKKKIICNSIRELSVTLEQIKQEAFRDKYINNIKAKILPRDQ